MSFHPLPFPSPIRIPSFDELQHRQRTYKTVLSYTTHFNPFRAPPHPIKLDEKRRCARVCTRQTHSNFGLPEYNKHARWLYTTAELLILLHRTINRETCYRTSRLRYSWSYCFGNDNFCFEIELNPKMCTHKVLQGTDFQLSTMDGFIEFVHFKTGNLKRHCLIGKIKFCRSDKRQVRRATYMLDRLKSVLRTSTRV